MGLVQVAKGFNHTYRVVGIRHGVEWPYRQGVFIQHVEVSIILKKQ